MIKKNRKYLLGIIGILLILIMFVGVKYIMKPKYVELPEVKLREIKSNKSFAIMIQENSEKDKYQEYQENTWPGDDYQFKEAKCIDNNGAEVKDAITYKDGKITLTTNKTIYCTVYFDKSIIGKLRETDTNKNLSTDIQGDMYRYQGTDNVANWICFGTEDNCGTNETDSDGDSIPDGIDKYMYRIIGVTKEGQLYLLKETFIKEGNIFGFAWNSKYLVSDCLGDKCEWPNVDIYKRLNGTSNGEIPGSGYNNGANTDIFVDSTQYDYLQSGDKDGVNGGESPSEWYNLIAYHEWMYGDTNIHDGSANAYNGDYMHAIETGKTSAKRRWPDEEQGQTTCSSISECAEKDYTWSKSVPAKIGLMYMHDVDYAYIGGNPGNRDNIKNSWIHFKKDGYNTSRDYEYLITRFGIGDFSMLGVYSRTVNPIGVQGASYIMEDDAYRPVFYLESSAKIASGDGTKSNPYILDVQT